MFATSTNRAPRTATPGAQGEARTIKFELRLIADIGLVGLPNAGKSTLLRTVTRAKPKTADYPFTTLEPHLGVVDHKGQVFVLADLPGLIEGASEGAGLGHRFLRHVTRNRVLLHLVDCSVELDELLAAIATIRQELCAYDPALGERTQILVFTKADLLDDAALATRKAELAEAGHTGFFISASTQQGLEPLLDWLAALAPGWREQAVERAQAEAPEELVETATGSETSGAAPNPC